MSARVLLSSYALGVALLALPTTASAQTRGDEAAAEAIFQLARDALDHGRLDEACERFRESYRLDPAGGTLLNLGVCEEQRGRLAAAWEAFSEGLTKLPATDARAASARARLAAIESRLPRLTVTARAHGKAGVRVFRDGVELREASLGVPLPVDPGPHQLRIEASGHAPNDKEIVLREGERSSVAVDLGPPLSTGREHEDSDPARIGPAPSADVQRSATTSDGSSALGTTKTVSFVTAGILGAAGLAFGALTLEARGRINAECIDSGACTGRGLDAVDDARRWGTVSTVSFVAAGAALVTGIVLVLASPARASNTPHAASRALTKPMPPARSGRSHARSFPTSD